MTGEQMTEEIHILVANLRAGDQHAYEEVVKRFSNLVFSQAYSITSNVEDAKEVTQEVFLNLFRKIDTLRKPEALKSFLGRSARNRALDFLRRRKGNSVSLEVIGELEHESNAPLPGFNLMKEEEGLEMKKEVAEAISQLPPDQQTVIRLRYEENLSYAEIAKRLDSGLNIVRGRLYRAHKTLAGKLGSLLRSGYEH